MKTLLYIFLLVSSFLFQIEILLGQLNVEIQLPISTPDGLREIDIEKYPVLYVNLTNTGETPVRLWKDWNSWGYYNLTLIWESEDQSYAIRRLSPENWDGDFSDFWVLPKGESLILSVNLLDGQWEGIPLLIGEEIPARLYAIYENKPDLLAKEFNIWVGKIQSPVLEVIFK